jgi:hypothetical protein
MRARTMPVQLVLQNNLPRASLVNCPPPPPPLPPPITLTIPRQLTPLEGLRDQMHRPPRVDQVPLHKVVLTGAG